MFFGGMPQLQKCDIIMTFRGRVKLTKKNRF